MVELILIIVFAVVYLATGCLITAKAFAPEWHHRRSFWQTVSLIMQITLLMLLWPFAVVAVVIAVAVDR